MRNLTRGTRFGRDVITAETTTKSTRAKRGWYGRIEGMPYERITVGADQMGGQPCIRGLRIPVATVVAMLADGLTHDDILAAYPDLERADIDEALRYAAEAVRERELPLRSVV